MRRLCKTVILPVFCLVTKMKSSIPIDRELRFYFCSGVEYDQNPWFIEAFYEIKHEIIADDNIYRLIVE